MPRRDGLGPMGAGPATGWGAGPCGGGYGMGRYPGRGRGFRHVAGYCPPMFGWGMAPQVNREDVLRQQKEFMEEQIRLINDELKAEKEE
jgi:hypothetical protein